MTEKERDCCLAIEFPNVNYVPGSWSKRFSRDMAAKARDVFWDQKALTERQRESLLRTMVRFRRQIPDKELVGWAKRELEAIERATRQELAELEAAERKKNHRGTEAPRKAGSE